MPESTHFDRLRAMLLMNERFARLDPGITERALGSIRSEFESTRNPFDRNRAICAQIGAADNPEWRGLLMQIRDRFEAEVLAEKIGEIEQAFAPPEEGWTAWVTALVEAIFQLSSTLRGGA